MNKLELRKKAKALLSKISSSDFDKWNNSLSKHFINFLRNENSENKIIGGFAPILHEPVWSLDLTSKSRTAFPSFDRQMLFRFASFEELEKRTDFGVEILGPKEKAEEVVPDVLLVPGLGFSLKGERLGRGKGFYDRYLESFKGIKVGICYECQISTELPTEAHDQKVNFIITEKNIYRIRS